MGAANSFVEAQNWQAARKEFQAVLDLDPKNAQAKAGLAAVETRIPTPVPQTYSRLEILQVTVAGPQVVVVGATDLPDGCEVSIGIDTPGSPDDKYLGMYLFFPVVGGKVEGRLVAPRPGLTAAERLRFMRGPYEIELMVTPMSTSNAKYIGPKGEYLTGPLATGSDMGFRILDLVRTYNLRLNG
ncbi:MAG: hypothetical protein JOZ39_10995 [Chloroflexi bacterium]|nr:hypothetical protein [Chloroflexota bacterium]